MKQASLRSTCSKIHEVTITNCVRDFPFLIRLIRCNILLRLEMSCGRTVGKSRTEEGGGRLGRLAGTRSGFFLLQAGHQRTVVQHVARSGALLFADVAAERVDIVHDVVGIVVFASLTFRARREVVETGEEEFFLVGEAFQEVFDGLHVGLVVA